MYVSDKDQWDLHGVWTVVKEHTLTIVTRHHWIFGEKKEEEEKPKKEWKKEEQRKWRRRWGGTEYKKKKKKTIITDINTKFIISRIMYSTPLWVDYWHQQSRSWINLPLPSTLSVTDHLTNNIKTLGHGSVDHCHQHSRLRINWPVTWTLSVTDQLNETLTWLSSLPILMQESFWWWQRSDRYIISLPFPPPP